MLNKILASLAFTCAAATAQAATLDTFDLDVTTAAGTDSSVTLMSGIDYLITITGTVLIGNNAGDMADAEYVNIPGNPQDTDIRGFDFGVLIDGLAIDWGPYQANSVYSTLFTGQGSTVTLAYGDTFYDDNTGALSVTISDLSAVPLPAGLPLLLAGLGGLWAVRRRG